MLWNTCSSQIPKAQRHSFAARIDSLFVEIIEAIAAASFLLPHEKHPYVKLAIRKLDALKLLIMIIWESKSLDDKKYIDLSMRLDEIGRNLGGWSGQLLKQNSPTKKVGEK